MSKLIRDDIIELELADGSVQECVIIAVFSAEKQSYLALQPIEEEVSDSDEDPVEIYLYKIIEEDLEKFSIDNIQDDDEYETARAAFGKWLENQPD